MEVYNDYIIEAKANAPKPKNWLTAAMGGNVPVTEMSVSKTLAEKMAKENDIAMITIGRNSGEASDREAIPGDFYLTDVEKAMIANVVEAFNLEGKQAVVILNIGGVIETDSWKKIPDAVLLAWQPGQEAGNSVIDVLTGKVNPSGKLTMSFPISYNDVPSASSFPGHKVEAEEETAPDLSGFSFSKRIPWEVVYDEDIFVGYRYYNTFNLPLSYEFGYGLSYTEFEYSNLTIDSKNLMEACLFLWISGILAQLKGGKRYKYISVLRMGN